MKTYVHIKTCTWFIAALLVIAKTGNDHAIKHYSAIKRNTLLTDIKIWMKFQRSMLSEKGQSIYIAF